MGPGSSGCGVERWINRVELCLAQFDTDQKS